jgi:RNA polymerase sigma factor (sigma-70 family)
VPKQEDHDRPILAFIDSLVARDDAAWRKFLAEIGPLIGAICFSYGLGDEEKEDIAQTVVLKLLDNDCRALRTLNIGYKEHFYAWARVIVVRAALDVVRLEQNRTDREIRWLREKYTELGTSGPQSERIESKTDVENTIRMLPPDDQVLFWMDYEDMPDKDKGRILGISPAAVQQRLTRMRKRLIELMNKAGTRRNE